MARQIKWAPGAAADLEDICCFIARDSEHYASLFAARIIEIVKGIPEFPKSGRVVPEYEDENIREKIYKNYRIIYRLKGSLVEIVAICHGMKQLNDIL
jgi:toxin ParE1/3/4